MTVNARLSAGFGRSDTPQAVAVSIVTHLAIRFRGFIS